MVEIHDFTSLWLVGSFWIKGHFFSVSLLLGSISSLLIFRDVFWLQELEGMVGFGSVYASPC